MYHFFANFFVRAFPLRISPFAIIFMLLGELDCRRFLEIVHIEIMGNYIEFACVYKCKVLTQLRHISIQINKDLNGENLKFSKFCNPLKLLLLWLDFPPNPPPHQKTGKRSRLLCTSGLCSILHVRRRHRLQKFALPDHSGWRHPLKYRCEAKHLSDRRTVFLP